MMLASEIARSLKLDEIIRAEQGTCLAAFADTLKRAPDTSIEQFLSGRPADDRSKLVELIALDLRHCKKRGLPCHIESYFERFPNLLNDREKTVDLIYAEYCERRRYREEVKSEEYYRRFPEHRKALEYSFRIDGLFPDESLQFDQLGQPVLNMPEEGDEFLDFRLVSELGRGAFGRVFLAHQTNLSDRQVVVKVTSLQTIEHQTLARLKHPHIVPVHSVHRDDLTGLQAVCMPNQCAVALGDVIKTWRDSGLVPQRADSVLEALRELIPLELRMEEPDTESPPFPARASYVYACCWLMYTLAGALAHAHARGILHRDLKPSNILLTAQGQPLLVDFNLAFNQVESQGDHKAFFGGTMPFMPPEQLEAFHPTQQGSPDHVDPRSDIYSLAATFFEVLTGQFPFGEPRKDQDRLTELNSQIERRHDELPSARELNSRVPADLDALIVKCLRPKQDDRYETAADLAADLKQFLEDKPLRHIGRIPNRQIALKFLRRNRRRLAVAIVLVACSVVFGGMTYRNHLEQVRLEAENKEKEEKLSHSKFLQRLNAEVRVEAELELLDDSTKNDPKQLPVVIHRKANEYYGQNKYYLAIYAATKAIELGYQNFQLFWIRGQCHANLDDDEQALENFTAAIELDPDNGRLYLSRAFTFASSREGFYDFDKALLDAERALELGTTDKDPKFFYLDVARVFSAVTKPVKKETDPARLARLPVVLRKAEENLTKALDLGLTPETVREQNDSDRFRMLDPVLDRPAIRQRMGLVSK